MSEEEIKALSTVGEQDDIKMADDYMANLPTAVLPEFKTDKHVIRYLHESMMEGDKSKMEAILIQMLPSGYFANKEHYLLTVQGNNHLMSMVNMADDYSIYYCMSPKVKSEKQGQVDFYTRDMRGSNRIKVYQAKDLSWKVTSFSDPSFIAGTDMKNLTTNLNAIGDKNCGEPLDIEVPEAIVIYSVGDRVSGEYRGQWYSGTVDKIDTMMKDRYFVKFDAINGQWITADIMKRLEEEEKSKPEGNTSTTNSTSDSKTKNDDKSKDKSNTDKAKSKFNSIKGKIKIK